MDTKFIMLSLLKKQHWLVYCFIIAVSFAIFTQFPMVDKLLLSNINQAIWFFIILAIVMNNKNVFLSKYFKYMITSFVFLFVLSNLLLLMQVKNIFPSLVRMMIIPILIYFSSCQIAKVSVDKDTLKVIISFFWIMCFVMAFQIAPNLVTNYNVWADTEVYLYDGATHKNSTAQLLSCGVLVVFVYIKAKNVIELLLKSFILIVFFMALIYVQSRSCLIAIAVALILVILVQTNTNKKIFHIFLLIISYVFVLNSNWLMNLLRHTFFIDKYSDSNGLDYNDFSSGRLEHWSDAFQVFKQHPFFGAEVESCDNFYINTLASSGIVIGFLFIILWIIRIIYNFKLLKIHSKVVNDNRSMNLLFAITVFYFTVSLFEAFPPYGPGVATMLLWLLCGYVDGEEYLDQNE